MHAQQIQNECSAMNLKQYSPRYKKVDRSSVLLLLFLTKLLVSLHISSKLTMNASMCKYMVISKRKITSLPSALKFGGSELESVKCFKYLCLLSQNLLISEQINSTCMRSRKIIDFLFIQFYIMLIVPPCSSYNSHYSGLTWRMSARFVISHEE